MFSDDPKPPTRIGPLPRAILIAGGAFIACMLAELISMQRPHALLVWPASGVAFAAGQRWGAHWTLPAAAGAAIWSALYFEGPLLPLLGGIVTIAGPLIALGLMNRLERWKPAEYRLESAIRHIVAIVIVAAPIDAVLASIGASAGNLASNIHPTHVFTYWWLIDSLGMLLVVPACARPAAADTNLPRSSEIESILDPGALTLTAMVVVTSLLVGSIGPLPYAYALSFFYIPIVSWTAIRCGERATALTLLATAAAILMTRAWQTTSAGDDSFRGIEASVLVFAAVLVANMLQAIATDRRQALVRVARLARQDMTTGLLNDRGLLAEVGERLAARNRPDYGLIGLHIANFDALNDLCGAIEALQLEQSIAALLMRQPATRAAARISSGRYSLLVEAATVADVRSIAREIYAQLNGQVYRTAHGTVRLQACVGGLLIDRHALINSEDCLLSLSDALAIAASVRDPQLFVEPLSQTMIDARRAHQSKIEHIRESIRERRFALHAQPIIDPDAPQGMMSYEILIRLLDRDGTLIRPPEFLSLAVQAQMTPAMDRGVIGEIFAWLADHPEALARTWKCSINLAGLTMSEGTIADYIREQRTQYAIPPEKIVFEITESEAIRSPGAASRLVDELKSQGFGIALDDFGTGLATFEYLKRFPLDYLKIDGSFIRNLANSPIDEEIVMSTVRVARRLNVRTIAEHVQSQAVFDRLAELGVGHVQGELIGMAQPLDELFAAAPFQAPARRATIDRADEPSDA